MEYIHDVFYHIEELPLETRLELINEAMGKSDDISLERIAWPGGHRRRLPHNELTPTEWLEKYAKEDSMYRFIHRKGYSNPYHVQVVIRAGDDFFWVNLKEEELSYFLEKYKMGIL